MTVAADRRKRGARAILEASDATPHTVELTQHHTVGAPGDKRRGDRVRANYGIVTRLDLMFDGGDITPGEHNAGVDYRRWREIGEHGANSGLSGSGGGGDGCPTQARLDALQMLRKARAGLCMAHVAALDCVADDRPWTDLAARLGVGEKSAKVIAIEALRTLAGSDRPRSSRVRGVVMAGVG